MVQMITTPLSLQLQESNLDLDLDFNTLFNICRVSVMNINHYFGITD